MSESEHHLWTYSIDIGSGEIEESHFSGDEYEDYPVAYSPEEADILGEEAGLMGAAGYATYNDDGWNCVYAESVVSSEDAKRLVLEKCIELWDKFAAAVDSIT